MCDQVDKVRLVLLHGSGLIILSVFVVIACLQIETSICEFCHRIITK